MYDKTNWPAGKFAMPERGPITRLQSLCDELTRITPEAWARQLGNTIIRADRRQRRRRKGGKRD